MKKMYQTEWMGIRFSDFCSMSPNKLADSDFYAKFYEILFSQCKDWKSLDSSWVGQKRDIAKFIENFISIRGLRGKILSVGCGLGTIEHELLLAGFNAKRLEVSEIVETPLRWLKDEVAKENIHIGMVPECIPKNSKYSAIYLVGVDYVLDQKQFVSLLIELKKYLEDKGRVLIISGSFYNKIPSLLGLMKGVIKQLSKYVLDLIGKSSKVQFWGYMRNHEDYQEVFNAAGLVCLENGLVDVDKQALYWISGQLSRKQTSS